MGGSRGDDLLAKAEKKASSSTGWFSSSSTKWEDAADLFQQVRLGGGVADGRRATRTRSTGRGGRVARLSRRRPGAGSRRTRRMTR
jgi:hypothetical protein